MQLCVSAITNEDEDWIMLGLKSVCQILINKLDGCLNKWCWLGCAPLCPIHAPQIECHQGVGVWWDPLDGGNIGLISTCLQCVLALLQECLLKCRGTELLHTHTPHPTTTTTTPHPHKPTLPEQKMYF